MPTGHLAAQPVQSGGGLAVHRARGLDAPMPDPYADTLATVAAGRTALVAASAPLPPASRSSPWTLPLRCSCSSSQRWRPSRSRRLSRLSASRRPRTERRRPRRAPVAALADDGAVARVAPGAWRRRPRPGRMSVSARRGRRGRRSSGRSRRPNARGRVAGRRRRDPRATIAIAPEGHSRTCGARETPCEADGCAAPRRDDAAHAWRPSALLTLDAATVGGSTHSSPGRLSVHEAFFDWC
jgi:hypothetical protein